MYNFQKLLDTTVDGTLIRGAVLQVQHKDDAWTGSAGNLQVDHQYFIASTTKLYLTAILVKLREEGRLSFTDRITTYLPPDVTVGLHRYQGTDYSDAITIQHLMAHTSGLPDYFEDKDSTTGTSLLQQITTGDDRGWTFEDVVAITKQQPAHFPPNSSSMGIKSKTHYSDTNFQLLQKIIEVILGQDIATVFQEHIFTPLQMHQTYLYTNTKDTTPQALNYKKKYFAHSASHEFL